MTPRDDTTLLKHMLEYTREAIDLSSGKSRKDLDNNRMLELALTRLVEMVGEAASRTTSDCRQLYPQIPWPDIIGLRNRLVHGYNSVDLDILWDILQMDFPPLATELEEIIRERC